MLRYQTQELLVCSRDTNSLYYLMLIAAYSLAAVNFFLACVGVTQVTRILLYQRSLKDGSAQAVTDEAKDLANTVKGAAKDVVAKGENVFKS